MDKSTFTKIKSEREKRGITQAQLAKRLGVSILTLRLWETGNAQPRPARQEVILKFLQES